MSQRSVRSNGQLQAKSVTEEVPAPRQTKDAAEAQVPALPAADPHHLPHPLAAPRAPPLPEGRGDAAALPPAVLVGAAEVTVHTDIGRVTRAETRGGAAVPAAQSVPLITESAAVRDSADPAGGAGAGLRPVAAVAERGGAAGNASEVEVRAAAGGNKKLPAGTERRGKGEAGVMRRIRGGKTKILIKRKTNKRARKKGGIAAQLGRKMTTANRKEEGKARTQTPTVSGSLGKTAKVARKAPPKLAESTLIQSPVGAGPLPLRLAKKRSLKNQNVVDQGQRKDLTSLVRRQAANTSLSRDQGSIHFAFFSFIVELFYLSVCE